MSKLPPEHNSSWFLDYFADMDHERKDRSFAFLLGAGASRSSEIPTATDLAFRWLQEMQAAESTPETQNQPLEEWATAEQLDISGFSLGAAAEFYPDIYERRFRLDSDEGIAQLEKTMESRRPSIGYAVLAEILSTTRHRVVVTTNFDNLVTDALAINTRVNALVCGHESLTQFVQVNLRRPLVAKIHRDLLLAPGNLRQDILRLSKAWTPALQKLFEHYTPIVLGYGGNDGSLMSILESMRPQQLARPIIWCYYKPDGPPGERIQKLLSQDRGVLVPIDGFDDIMLQLADRLQIKVSKLPQRIVDRAFKQATSYKKELEKFDKEGTITLRLGTDDANVDENMMIEFPKR